MRKLFLLIPILAFALMANAAIPELTKSTPLTLTAATEGFSQSANANALDGEWINWHDGTIHQGYAKWRVNVVNSGIFSVTVDMKSLNTYKYRICVLDPATNDTLAICYTEKADRHTEEGDEEPKTKIAYENAALPTLTKLDMFAFDAGEYDIIVTNVIQWSKGQVRGITLTHEQGDVTTAPTTLSPDNAYLSPRAWVDKTGTVDSILFTPRNAEGYNLEEWVKWAIKIPETAYYDFTANTFRASSQKFEITLLNQDESATLISNDNGGESIGSGNKSISTGQIYLAKGIYVLRVRNIYQYAESRLLNAVVTYKGGHPVDVPGTLDIDHVVLSNEAWVDKTGTVDSILFTARGSEGHNSVNWVKWKVKVATEAAYNFKANVYRPDGSQRYEIKVLSDDENTEYASNSLTGMPTGSASINSGCAYLEPGTYTIKVRNTYDYAESRLLSVQAEYMGGAVIALATDANTALPFDEAWFTNCTRTAEFIKFKSSGSPWIKWNVSTTETKVYDISMTINAPNSHQLRVDIYEDEAAEPVASVSESYVTVTDSVGDVPLALGRVSLVGGKNYIVKVTNTSGSKSEITNLTFAPVVATTVNLPNTLGLDNSVLSARAHLTDGKLYFAPIGDTNPVGEWARWSVATDHNGLFLFTMGVNSDNAQSYKITILDDGDNEVAFCDLKTNSGAQTLKHYFQLATGNYSVKVENTYAWSHGHLTSLAVTEPNTAITMSEEATDNSAWSAKVNDGNNYDVQIIRTLRAGMYNTFCLPFEVTPNEAKEIFGLDIEIYTLETAVVTDNVLYVTLDPASDIYPGTPVFIKPSHDIVNPIFDDVTFTAAAPSATTKTNADFEGTFVKSSLEPNQNILYLGTDNTLYYPAEPTPIKGMRGWFVIHDTSSPAPAIRQMRIVEKTDTTTDITTVEESDNKAIKTITNGQLIIIRDGVRYNAMGIRIE